ncbi:MAG: 16S rRNA (cytosine(1402)-N(4))-methyltransferase RsmH [Planctomycetes bacterium]|nr:16S rRNA (cytosine(1402)-N(4))-methyltransferase RsmH [Planctomycetota bacterium]
MVATEAPAMQERKEKRDPREKHVPVLAREIVELFCTHLGADASGALLDGTLGLGGHAELLLQALPALELLGLDQDPRALELARERLAPHAARTRLFHARISEIGRVLQEAGEPRLAGMLFDLGVSSMQIDEAARGFSFQADGPLDMRMDPRRDRTAAQIVNTWDERDLADLFFFEGGETRARVIARAIVEARRRAPFLRTGALADLVDRVLRAGARAGKIHPATLCFQALRRAVNEEGEELRAGLAAAERHLAPGGILAVISFHSGEDREVKRFLAEASREGRFEVLTRNPIEAEAPERRANARSRSAKLRAARRLPAGSLPPARDLVRAHSSPLFARLRRGQR